MCAAAVFHERPVRPRLGPVIPGETRNLTKREAAAIGAPETWRVSNRDGELVLLRSQKARGALSPAWTEVVLPGNAREAMTLRLMAYWSPPETVQIEVTALKRILVAIRSVLHLPVQMEPELRSELVWAKRHIGG